VEGLHHTLAASFQFSRTSFWIIRFFRAFKLDQSLPGSAKQPIPKNLYGMSVTWCVTKKYGKVQHNTNEDVVKVDARTLLVHWTSGFEKTTLKH
jgi:hypothetical protein